MNEMIPPTDEYERTHYDIKEIPPLGVGNPESSISYVKQLESGELTAEVAEKAVELIMSGECMREINEKDDGCIDGRHAVQVVFPTEAGEFIERPVANSEEHLRAKVAGGGYITALAMRVGSGEASDSARNDLAGEIRRLATAGICCGAHTGEHGHGDATDCGANDKFPLILENGIRFQDVIAANTVALIKEAGLEVNEALLGDVFTNWKNAVDRQYGKESTGATRFDVIEEGIVDLQQEAQQKDKPVAVTKNLGGDHKEDFIVVNYRDGETFSQPALNERLTEQFPDVQAQAFVVDAPRIVAIAKARAGEDEEAFQQSLYAGVAFQLATAATLTDGSLRTFVVK